MHNNRARDKEINRDQNVNEKREYESDKDQFDSGNLYLYEIVGLYFTWKNVTGFYSLEARALFSKCSTEITLSLLYIFSQDRGKKKNENLE